MANTTLTPNMSLVVPTVAVDPGPDWANNVNASLSIIDGHNHSSGSGTPIAPDGLNISTDLPFNNNSATELKSAQFQTQGAVLPGSVIDALYVVNDELFYNDAIGNQVQITLSGSVTGSSGTITGLPSGTASASYSLGVFSFKAATNTPATMNVGPLVIGAAIANPKTVTLGASAAQPANYPLTLPLALPVSQSLAAIDGAGDMTTPYTLPAPTAADKILSLDGSDINANFTLPAVPAVPTFITVDSSSVMATTYKAFQTPIVSQSLVGMTAANEFNYPFQYNTLSGSLTAGATVVILANGTYGVFFGGFGTTTHNGGANPLFMMGTDAQGIGIERNTGTGDVILRNYDNVNTNSYKVTFFYIP
jgi:hypothetical protein